MKLKPVLVAFMASMVLANISGSMFYPFFPIYLKELGLPVSGIGLFFTLSAVFPLAFQILGGWISDRIGRLRSIAIGSVAGAVSWAGMVASPATPWPAAGFLASQAVSSITVALVAPSYSAFIAEQSAEGDRNRVFAGLESVYMIVGIVGPPLGGYIAARVSYSSLTLIAAGLYWAATVMRVLMSRLVADPRAALAAPAPGPTGSRAGFLSDFRAALALILAGGALTWLFAIDGALDVSENLSSSLVPLYLKDVGSLDEVGIGFLQSLSAACTAVAMVPMGIIADRRGERLPIALGCVLIGASFIAMCVFVGPYGFAAAFALGGLGRACYQPAKSALVSKLVPEDKRGLAFGFLGTSIGAFSLAAPAVGGLLWKSFFPALPFLASAVLVLLAAFGSRALDSSSRRRLPSTP
jgi:MFS family permease